MPTYRITDPQSGRTLRVTGDSPPSEAELSELFASRPAPRQASPARPAGGGARAEDFAPKVSWLANLMRDDDAPAPERATATDVGIGVAKGAATTGTGLGELLHRIPGVSRAVDALYGEEGLSDRAFPAAREALRPTNTAQQVGFAGEQIAEHFLPVGAVSKVARAGQAAATTLAQTGDVRTAGVSGAITAAVPGVVGAAGRASQFFKKGAIKDITRALAPTKEWAKVDAARIAPGMLARGVKGSREGMLKLADEASDAVGARLGEAYRAAAEQGQTISGQMIQAELLLAKNALTVPNAAGRRVLVPGFEAAAKKLDNLGEFVAGLGDDIPVDKAHQVKTAWDRLVSSAGLYGPKSMSSATDNAEAWATREGASSIRRLLDDVPNVSALNTEYKFWRALGDVLKATELRTAGQSSGLFAAGGAGSAAIATAASGGGLGAAFMGGWAGKKLVEALQSPQFRTGVSAPVKDAIANALASGRTGDLIKALGKVGAASPSVAGSRPATGRAR